MTRALRVGFLVSGVLHVAVAVALSLSSQPDISGADEQEPITLRLAVFQPPPPAPIAPPTPQFLPTEPAAAQPPVEPAVVQAEPNPPPEPKPVEPTKPLVEKPPKLKGAAEHQRVARPGRVPAKAPTIETRSEPRPPDAATLVAKAEPMHPVAPTIDVQARQHYLAELAARINRSKFYPRTSRRLGEEGMAVVGFVIQRNGQLTDITIVESSGYRRLDDAALKTVKHVTPFERIPDSIDRDQWSITVPIAFSLRG